MYIHIYTSTSTYIYIYLHLSMFVCMSGSPLDFMLSFFLQLRRTAASRLAEEIGTATEAGVRLSLYL